MTPTRPWSKYRERVTPMPLGSCTNATRPATEQSIETALATRDRSILGKYGRFFSPIFQIISQKTDPERANQLLDDFFAAPN